jgi:hypothetical protein
MAKLNNLIKKQKISFDTHQAGDGQETKWRNLHLEKSIKGEKGKVRFPFLGKEKPSNSGMNDKNFRSVKSEVSKILKKNETLLNSLAEEIEKQLERWSSGIATIEDAKEAASRFAKYFDLDSSFIDDVAKYRQDRLIEFNTIHVDPETQIFYAIKQSAKNISIEERQKQYFY